MRLLHLWPFAIVITTFGAVTIAFTQCAVAELAVRFAARMYSADLQVRADKRDEWLQNLEDMKPSERPGHAGSLLWVGAKRAPRCTAQTVSLQRLRWLGPHVRKAIVSTAASILGTWGIESIINDLFELPKMTISSVHFLTKSSVEMVIAIFSAAFWMVFIEFFTQWSRQSRTVISFVERRK